MSTTEQPPTDAPLSVDSWPASYGEDAETRVGFFTDTSLCIGCKACEVACKEWNGVPSDGLNYGATSIDNSFDLGANRWRHVAFVEQQVGLEELAGRAAAPGADPVITRDVLHDPGGAGGAEGIAEASGLSTTRAPAEDGCGSGSCGCGPSQVSGPAPSGLVVTDTPAGGMPAAFRDASAMPVDGTVSRTAVEPGALRSPSPHVDTASADGCGSEACGCGSGQPAVAPPHGGLTAEELAAQGLTAPAPPELVPGASERVELDDLVQLAELGTSVTPEQDPTGVRWLMSSDVCKHCTKAACLEVCPTGAIFRSEFGTVVVQPDVCNGCGYCVVACPFGVLDRRRDDGRVWKCTLCYDRLRNDQEPACAKACPTDSIQFGPLEELRERAERRVEVLHERGETKAQLYLNTSDDGIGGAGAFFLLRDDPEVYGLPPDPVDTTTLAGEAWRAAGVAALGMAATVLGASLLGRRR